MSKRSDLVTIAAVGVLAYVISNIVHEGLGHGATCLAVGGKLTAISSAWLDCDEDAISRGAARAVSAAGTIANFTLGAILFAGLRRWGTSLSGAGRYFVWLLMIVNLLQAGGYLMFSPIFGFGDWGAFLEGYGGTSTILLKALLTTLGIAISLAAVVQGRRLLAPLLPPGEQAREVLRLCRTPYFVAAAVFLVAALRDPQRGLALTGVLAAHLGGTAWLAWFLPYIVKNEDGGSGTAVPRARGFWVAGSVAALLCVLVFGPSIRFR